MNNINEENIKFLSKPVKAEKVYIAKEAWKACKVAPAVHALSKSADYLISK